MHQQPVWQAFLSILIVCCTYGFPAVSVADAISPPQLNAKTFQYLLSNQQLFLGSRELESEEYRNKYNVVNTSTLLKAAILSHEAKQATPYSPDTTLLAQCQFFSQRIEIDNNIDTAEWLISTAGNNHCMQTSRYHPKTYWLLQQTENTPPTILLASRADSVFIYAQARNAKSPFRVITNRMQNKMQGTEIMCETVIHYQPEQGYRTSKATVYTYRYDPILSGKAWLPTTDRRYQCLP